MSAGDHDIWLSPSLPRGGSPLRTGRRLPLAWAGVLLDIAVIASTALLLDRALPAGSDGLGRVAATIALLYLAVGSLTRAFARDTLLRPRFAALLVCWLAAVALAIVPALLVAPDSAPAAGPLALFGMLGLAGLLGGRELLSILLAAAANAGLLRRSRVLVVARSLPEGQAFARRLRQDPDCETAGVLLAGTVLAREVREPMPDRVVVLAAGLARNDVAGLRAAVRDWAVPVDFVGASPDLVRAFPRGREVGSLPVFATKRPPLTRSERAARRGLDIAVAGSALLLLSPLLLTLSLLLAVRGVAPIVRQRRATLAGPPVDVFAFAEPPGRRGRLAATGLTELAALVNVLRGDLSLVGPALPGPRPTATDALVAAYAAAQGLKPGLARPALDVPDAPPGDDTAAPSLRAAEFAYLDEWTLLLDLGVLVTALGRLCVPERDGPA